jgi:tetratricopeptide (TPR) repeat protein
MQRLVVAAALLIGCRGDQRRAPHDEPAVARVASVVPALPRSPEGAQELRALDLEIARARTALTPGDAGSPGSMEAAALPRTNATAASMGSTANAAPPGAGVKVGSPGSMASRAPLGATADTVTGDPAPLITGLARRAAIRGRLEDFTEADQRSKAWIERAPADPVAWRSRVGVLTQLHRFAEARSALAHLVPLARDPSDWEALAATLDEAVGQPDRAVAYRERAAKVEASAVTITALAGNLAARGNLDEAIALIPRAAAALRDPSPVLVSWLLVQWGQLHTTKGEPAAARPLFSEAHARLPGYVEATVQLAHALRATGADPRVLASDALADGPHPELLALAGKTDEAAALWDRYTAAHREAFADHAARFYLAVAAATGSGARTGSARSTADASIRATDSSTGAAGATGSSTRGIGSSAAGSSAGSGSAASGVDAALAKAVALAADNFANRPTLDARALLVEAQVLAARAAEACSLVDALLASTRAHQFLAWRALTACGRTADAARVGTALGIR